MTLIGNDRKKLDDALKLKENTILLISDDPGTTAEVVHDKAEEIAKDWQYVFLIQDLSKLKPAERTTWFDEGGHYAVIGGSAKVVAVRGPLSDLILPSGNPSGIEIRWAFAQGDRLS